MASVNTREMQNIDAISSELMTKVDIPDEFRVDAKAFIQRPFFIDKVSFSTTNSRYTFLNSNIKAIPGDVVRSNASLLNVFKMAAYGRPDLVLNISMAGTITHSGCIIAGILPPMPRFPSGSVPSVINTILSGPHAFLYANEATSVNIEVPWYCNTDLATTDMEIGGTYIPTLDITGINGNYGTLVLYVLNPLQPSVGSSTSLTIVIEACFKNFDLVVPTPRYVEWTAQSGKKSNVGNNFANGLMDLTKKAAHTVFGDALDNIGSWAFGLTGLHNPNTPKIQERHIKTDLNFPNTVDAAQYFEKLDPFTDHNRLLKEPIFNTSVDEHSLKHISTKKQFLGTFQVDVSDDVGSLKWIRPISPFQGGYFQDAPSPTGQNNIACANNIETLHSMHRGWNGKLKLHLISVMNNKQQVKLKVIKMYNPSVRALSQYPVYGTIANAPSHLLEFTAGGQEQIVELPYLCRNRITPCSDNTDFEAMFHGLYYVYVAQNLVISDSSPTNVSFNVFLSAPDVTFYGYQTKNVEPRTWNLFDTPFQAQSGQIKVMNEPEEQRGIMRNDGNNLDELSFHRLAPIIDIRPTIRRMYKVNTDTVNLTQGQTPFVYRLSSFIGENPEDHVPSPIMLISRMYYGKSVGFKIRLRINIVDNSSLPIPSLESILLRVFYVPQNVTLFSTDRTITRATPNLNSIQSLADSGAIPLTHKLVSDQYSLGSKVIEFVIPDTSYYKFMGGPQKFEAFNTPTNNVLSQADFGEVVIVFDNQTPVSVTVCFDTFVGLTDESRFGFHSMASPINVRKGIRTLYLGNNTSAIGNPTSALNPYTYLGGFL